VEQRSAKGKSNGESPRGKKEENKGFPGKGGERVRGRGTKINEDPSF